MNHPLDMETCVGTARALQHQYENECPMRSFGEWALERVFPDVAPLPFAFERDFRGAERTTDARYYLIGALNSGRLPLESATQFLRECATAQH